MRVGIVGGGITGLALTHELARRGVESVLLEADPQPGGLIRTHRRGPHVLESGPQRARLVGPVRRLLSELGLDEQVLEAPRGARLFVWSRGRLRAVPRSPRELWTTDLLPPLARARAALEPLTAGLRADESVADYLCRKAGREAYRALLGPLVAATFGSDPAAMPARHALPMILDPLGVRRSLLAAIARRRGEAAPAFTLRDGMQTLPAALAERHADRLVLGTPVARVEREGEAFVLARSGAGGPAASERVDAVVLTTPAPVTARLLGAVAPDASNRLAMLTYNELVIIHLEVENTPFGFGFQVALGEPWRTRGVTWNAALFGRSHCTAYLGGGLDPDTAGASDEEAARIAVAEYRRMHGREAVPLEVTRARLPAYDGSWAALDGLELPDGVFLAANFSARLGIAGRLAQAEALAVRLADRGSGV